MKNYFNEKNDKTKKTYSVKQADIFKGIIEKFPEYRPDYYIATTFGLNFDRVINLMYDVSFDILYSGRFDIYYDRYKASNSFSGKINGTDIGGAFSGGIHSVNLDRNFHPKLQLLRLVSGKDTMYAVTVASKNLTSDDSAEVYVVLTGSPVGDTAEQKENIPNGKALKDFLCGFVKTEESAAPDTVQQILDDMGRTEFIPYNMESKAEAVFLSQTAVFEKIKMLSELVIVTPFISKSAVESIGRSNIKMIVVRSELKDNDTSGENTEAVSKRKYIYTDISEIWDEKINFYSMKNLHGKIYCGRIGKDKTALVIGSSNCTASGLGIATEGNTKYNSELNVMLTFNDSDREFYQSFSGGFCDKLDAAPEKDNCIDKEDEAKKLRRDLDSIIGEVTFAGGEYTVKININSLKNFNIVKVGQEVIYDKDDAAKCKDSIRCPSEYISVYIDDVKINDVFLPAMVNNKNDRAYKEHTETVRAAVKKELHNHFERYIMSGGKMRSLSTRLDHQESSEGSNEKNKLSVSSLGKDELYERLLKYAALLADRDIFKARLEKLYKESYSAPKNHEYKKEAELLEMLLNTGKYNNTDEGKK